MATAFTSALEGMKLVKSENDEMLAKPFLDVCKNILPVLDEFGAAMALVKSDIGGNITVNIYYEMNTKMKGLLKGLRYISQIFEAKDDDDENDDSEMQIGFPTDVKHVAHIGWDDRAVTTPSWMNEFQSAPLSNLGSEPNTADHNPNISHSLDLTQIDRGNQIQTNPIEPCASSPSRDQTERNLSELPLPKTSKRQSKIGTTAPKIDPSSESSAAASRHSRRNKSSESITTDALEGSNHRRARRHNRLRELESGSESPGQDPPKILKPTRRKKKSSRSASEDGFNRSSQSKALNGYGLGLDEEVSAGGLPPLRPIMED